MSLEKEGFTELQSTQSELGGSLWRNECFPMQRHLGDSIGFGEHREKDVDVLRDLCRRLGPGRALVARSGCALSLVRLWTMSSWPFFRRLAAMRLPMMPSPMNPIFMSNLLKIICRRGTEDTERI